MNLIHVRTTVSLKLRDKNPELYRRLQQSNELDDFLDETSEEIKDRVVEAVLAAGNRPEFAKASEHLARLQAMEATGRETLNTLLAELEFPSDDSPEIDSGSTYPSGAVSNPSLQAGVLPGVRLIRQGGWRNTRTG